MFTLCICITFFIKSADLAHTITYTVVEYIQYVKKVLIQSSDWKSAIYKIIYTSTKLNIVCEHIEQGAYFMI